jgi:hypothetical protein
MVESITKNDAVVAYEAHIKIGKKSLEVKVSPDGQLISTESDEDEEDDRAIDQSHSPAGFIKSRRGCNEIARKEAPLPAHINVVFIFRRVEC